MIIRLKFAANIFIFELISWVILKYIVPRDDTYFIVAGIFSLFLLKRIANLGNDQLAIDMVRLALIMLVLQIMGFAFYHFDISKTIYNVSVYLCLFLEFLRLLIVRRDDGMAKSSFILRLFSRSFT